MIKIVIKNDTTTQSKNVNFERVADEHAGGKTNKIGMTASTKSSQISQSDGFLHVRGSPITISVVETIATVSNQ